MTKFVILGSCRFEPYEILAVPNKIPNAWNTDRGYDIAAKKFHPAMTQADVIIVYAPDGVGEHTQRDIDFAKSIGKKVYRLTEDIHRSNPFYNDKAREEFTREIESLFEDVKEEDE